MARLRIKIKGKWHIGQVVYGTLEEAQARKAELITLGSKSSNIQVVTELGAQF